MGNIRHRIFQSASEQFLVDNTRDLVIFLDDRGFGDHHFEQ